jgi:DNA-binding NarL/FixJ family response regulator
MPLRVDQVVSRKSLLAAPWATLPRRMRLLAIADTPQRVQWLRQVFDADRAVEVILIEAIGLAAGVERLRDELFDAILIAHDAKRLDALDLAAGLRAGGAEEAIVILGDDPHDEALATAYESGADAYLSIQTTTVRGLLWALAKGIDRQRLQRENQRLTQYAQRHTEDEQRETQQLLLQQKAIVADLESLRESTIAAASGGLAQSEGSGAAIAGGAPLGANYRELLRAYVMMGAGGLSSELERFTEQLAASGLSARQTLELHLCAVEELVAGLQPRGSRHVLGRADLLILELMAHLADWYRQRYHGQR